MQSRYESNRECSQQVKPPFPERCQQKGTKENGIGKPQGRRGGLAEERSIPIRGEIGQREKQESAEVIDGEVRLAQYNVLRRSPKRICRSIRRH